MIHIRGILPYKIEEEDLDLTEPFASKNPKLVQDFAKKQSRYSQLGLIGGLICIVLGVLLFLLGIDGSTSWSTKLLGLESDLADAAPGAILFVVGLIVIYLTRFKIKIHGK